MDFDSAGYLDAAGDGLLFRFVGGLASTGSDVFLTDKHNNRVLYWLSAAGAFLGASPDAVLGQDNLSTNNSGSDLNKLNWPAAVSVGGSRLAVADTFNNRVLVWDQLPTAGEHGGSATCAIKLGTTAGIAQFGSPWGVWTDGTRLLVSDTFGQSHRVYIWSDFWSSGSADCTRAPDYSLTAKSPSTGESQLWAPRGISSDGTRLFVSETNRFGVSVQESRGVYVWNAFPTEDTPYDDFIITTDTGNGAPMPPPVSLGEGYASLTRSPLSAIGVYCDSTPSSAAPDYYVAVPTAGASLADGSGMVVADNTLLISSSSDNFVLGFSLPLHSHLGESSCQDVDETSSSCQLADGVVRCSPPYDVSISEAGTRASHGIISHGRPQTDGTTTRIFSAYEAALYGFEAVPESSGPPSNFRCDLNSWQTLGFHDATAKAYQARFTVVAAFGLLHWANAPDVQEDCQTAVEIERSQLGLSDTSRLHDVAWTDAESTLGGGFYVASAEDTATIVDFFPGAELDVLETGGSAAASCRIDIQGIAPEVVLAANAEYLAVGTGYDVSFYSIAEDACPSTAVGSLSELQAGQYQVRFCRSIALSSDGKMVLPDSSSKVFYWSNIQALLAGTAPDAVLGESAGVSQTLMALPAYVDYDERNALLWVGEHDWGSRMLVFASSE
jgi:hypothetical protein